jgi:hypothetical protein
VGVGHVRDCTSPDFLLGVFALLDRCDSIEVLLPDRQAIGIRLSNSQFNERELFARIDKAVERDPAFVRVAGRRSCRRKCLFQKALACGR